MRRVTLVVPCWCGRTCCPRGRWWGWCRAAPTGAGWGRPPSSPESPPTDSGLWTTWSDFIMWGTYTSSGLHQINLYVISWRTSFKIKCQSKLSGLAVRAQSSEQAVRASCQSKLSEQAVRESCQSKKSAQAVRASCQSKLSEQAVRASCPSSELQSVNASCQSKLSEQAVRARCPS